MTGFLEKLTDGTIRNLRPDGAEMVGSMNRAVVTADGSVEWSGQCFFSTPLAHERATVLDTYFEDLSTELIGDYRDYEGESFMGVLKQLAGLRGELAPSGAPWKIEGSGFDQRD